MVGNIQYSIDPWGGNFLQVEFEASPEWSAGEGDTFAIDICAIALNGSMPLRINDVKNHEPAWWAGIHEKINNYLTTWEQMPLLAA